MSGHSQLRLALLLAVTAAAVAIGFFLVPPRAAVDLVQRAGYYAILLASILFAVALAQVWRNPENRPQWDRQDLAIALVSLALAALWQVHGLRGFKTLMDECDLSATAMSMHFDREVFMPLRVHNIHGVNEVLGGLVDKRPLFFPFVLSVVHDLTGYRLANVFWLNAGLSALALFLAGQLARRLAAGSMRAGVLAVLLLGGVPLFASSATGGGFEILNLVMICSVMLLALRTLREPSPARGIL